jgi:hypothetical protein
MLRKYVWKELTVNLLLDHRKVQRPVQEDTTVDQDFLCQKLHSQDIMPQGLALSSKFHVHQGLILQWMQQLIVSSALLGTLACLMLRLILSLVLLGHTGLQPTV